MASVALENDLVAALEDAMSSQAQERVRIYSRHRLLSRRADDVLDVRTLHLVQLP
jgi:hypothetical protein